MNENNRIYNIGMQHMSKIQNNSIDAFKCINNIANIGIQKYYDNISNIQGLVLQKNLKNMSKIQNNSIDAFKHINNIANIGMQKHFDNISNIQDLVLQKNLKNMSKIQNNSIDTFKCISNIANVGIQKYFKNISNIQDLVLQKNFKDIHKLQNSLEKQKILREKYLKQIQNEDITLNNNGSICVDSGIIAKEEIENKIYECLENLYDESNSCDNFEMKLEFAINKLKGISPELKKILKWIICSIVIPIIVGVSTNILSYNYERSSDKFLVKNIKKEFKYENFDNQTLKKYRIVSYNGLTIKSDCNMKSKTISKLNVGKVVKILYKNKNWSLIEWESEGENINKGWTLTRYLVRIKK